MSVDTLRETFHINRVTPDKIQDFLTAQTYRPEITKAKEDIKALPWVFLQHVCKRPIRQGKSPSYADDTGLLCIKPKNTNEMIVSLEELSYIQPASKDEVAGQRLQRGDIVITRSGSGTIGRASIFLSDEEVYTNDHLFIVRTDSADSHYTCAFLNTYWGHRLLEAGISGSTGQLNLSNEHIKGITLYTPAELVQKYIGDKVRQAERLRAWAKASIASADSIIADKFQHKLASSMTHCPRRLPTTLLSTISLGPEFARATEGQEKFEASSPLVKFTEFCKCGEPIRSEDRVLGIYPYYGASGPIDVHDEYNFDGEFLIVAQDGSIGCANIARGKIWANNHVWVVRIKSDYDPDAICRFLAMHFPYWKGVTTGSVVPKVTSENLLNVKVPDSIATDTEIGDYLRSADLAVRCSMALTNAAKLLVEALIEGQLTEAELLTAEKALQAGNGRLDRVILSRLNTDGIDGQGPALFGDLDELYHLLTQAEGD
jgi:type I restriction enzyme S subunit